MSSATEKERAADFAWDLRDDEERHREGKAMRNRGILLAISGVGLCLASSLLTNLVCALLDSSSESFGMEARGALLELIFLAGVLTALKGFDAYRTSKHYLVPDAETLLRNDRRAPVVYLRPFDADDAEGLAGDAADSLSGDADLEAVFGVSEEEQVASVMNEIGPFVAIGRPYDRLPKLGAARVLVSDEQWQAKVAEWISKAGLVVLRLGFTKGVEWEIEHIVERVPPERLVFLLPWGAGREYDEFRTRMASRFKKGLPEFPARKSSPARSLYGLLYFSPDWTPHVVPLRRPFYMKIFGAMNWVAKKSGLRFARVFCAIVFFAFAPRYWVSYLLKKALKPVVQQIGLNWKKWTIPPFMRVVTVACLLIALSAGLYAWRGYEIRQLDVRERALEQRAQALLDEEGRMSIEDQILTLQMGKGDGITSDVQQKFHDFSERKTKLEQKKASYYADRLEFLQDKKRLSPENMTFLEEREIESIKKLESDR